LCGEVDAVVPYIHDAYESLHAVYHRTCAALMRERLAQRQLRIQELYAHWRIRAVTAQEVARFDPDFHSFVNLNTPDEVARFQNVT
jgi:molybdopterin-guanine dinucleotide biosynthesis protein A